jgi:hypothetical protein
MRKLLVLFASLLAFACSGAEPAEPRAPTRLVAKRIEQPRPERRASVTAKAKVKAKARREPKPEPRRGLEQNQISSVVMSRYGEVNGCHAVGYGGDADAEGIMVVGLMVEPDGSVSSANLVRSSFANPQVERCVLDVTKSLQFPVAGNATALNWKFKFRARQRR